MKTPRLKPRRPAGVLAGRGALLAAVPAAALAATLAVALAVGPPPVALKTLELGRGPTLVLVHGLGTGRMVWMPTARKLIAAHRVVMVDLPGHGESPMPDPFSLEAAAEALDRVVAKQKAESTLVVGQGVGGLIALMAAGAHPDRARGLVLIDVALKSPVPIEEQQKRQFIDYMDQNYDVFARMVFTRMGRDSAQGVAIHALAAQVPPANVKAYFRELLNADGSRALHNIKCPLLFIASQHVLPPDKDWPTVGKQLGWDDPAIVTPRRLGASGALIMSDQPDSLALAITDFARQVMAPKK